MKSFVLTCINMESNEGTQSKTFIRNKIAQVASLVFVCDFPQRWPQFFHDLMARLTSGSLAVDMYLRILLSVQQEVVDRDIAHSPEEAQRNNLLKDAMREMCVTELANSWYQIMNISIRTRRRALECYIEPILMYGCEAWTISKQTQKKLEATEMWFLRRMLRISWTAKKTNDTVLEEAHTTRLLISKIRKRQATFFGHVMRREKLENLVTTGMLEGKRSRGKQREKLIEGLADWLKAGKSLEAIEATKDRKKWRTMIANAVKQGT
ncbi:exportin-t-like [Plakobranchus ocellatus]|uniref:Exportin-T n=1 Tax=Plakobranchus ocellatus TaxID=259542 RepID=A0AAV4A4W2_9GAST|nr:exportin-t-like [Plakobranchus ocellatus]